MTQYESGFRTILWAKLTTTATSMVVAVIPTVTAGRLYLNNWAQEEWISFTGRSGTTITWLTRGLSKTAVPSTAGTGKSWIAWTPVLLVEMHDQMVGSTQDNIFSWDNTFSWDNAFTWTDSHTWLDTRAWVEAWIILTWAKKWFGAPSLTTAERTALTAVNGYIVYDSDIGTHMQYIGWAWTNFATGAVVNANETVAGKVQLNKVAAGNDIWSSWAALVPLLSDSNRNIVELWETVTAGDWKWAVFWGKQASESEIAWADDYLFGIDSDHENYAMRINTTNWILKQYTINITKQWTPADDITAEFTNIQNANTTLTIANADLVWDIDLAALYFAEYDEYPVGDYTYVDIDLDRVGAVDLSDYYLIACTETNTNLWSITTATANRWDTFKSIYITALNKWRCSATFSMHCNDAWATAIIYFKRNWVSVASQWHTWTGTTEYTIDLAAFSPWDLLEIRMDASTSDYGYVTNCTINEYNENHVLLDWLDDDKVWLTDIRYTWLNRCDWIIIESGSADASVGMQVWWLFVQSSPTIYDKYYLNNTDETDKWTFSITAPSTWLIRCIWEDINWGWITLNKFIDNQVYIAWTDIALVYGSATSNVWTLNYSLLKEIIIWLDTEFWILQNFDINMTQVIHASWDYTCSCRIDVNNVEIDSDTVNHAEKTLDNDILNVKYWDIIRVYGHTSTYTNSTNIKATTIKYSIADTEVEVSDVSLQVNVWN